MPGWALRPAPWSVRMAAGDEARPNRGTDSADGFYPLCTDQVWEEAVVVADVVPEPPGKDRAGYPPAASITRGRA